MDRHWEITCFKAYFYSITWKPGTKTYLISNSQFLVIFVVIIVHSSEEGKLENTFLWCQRFKAIGSKPCFLQVDLIL